MLNVYCINKKKRRGRRKWKVGLEKKGALNRVRWRVGVGGVAVRVG